MISRRVTGSQAQEEFKNSIHHGETKYTEMLFVGLAGRTRSESSQSDKDFRLYRLHKMKPQSHMCRRTPKAHENAARAGSEFSLHAALIGAG
ncbi:MAG: hypothetical protein DMG09_10220 [Acidobacteria bacterium]|nr:MAG: hypothetical protein DMG09_10220 [Acidobacteriota bacterium]